MDRRLTHWACRKSAGSVHADKTHFVPIWALCVCYCIYVVYLDGSLLCLITPLLYPSCPTLLYCILLCSAVIYSALIYCTVLSSTPLYCITLYSAMLYFTLQFSMFSPTLYSTPLSLSLLYSLSYSTQALPTHFYSIDPKAKETQTAGGCLSWIWIHLNEFGYTAYTGICQEWSLQAWSYYW